MCVCVVRWVAGCEDVCVCVGVGKGDVCVNKLKICSGLDKTAVLNTCVWQLH